MKKTQKSETITVNLEDIVDVNINIIMSNGKPAIQFRKIVSACDKNMPYVQEILKKTLSNGNDVIMPVRLQIFNKPLALGKLKQVGLIVD